MQGHLEFDVVKANEDDVLCSDNAMWKPIVYFFYDWIYSDENGYVMKFRTEFGGVVDEVATSIQYFIIIVQDVDKGIAHFGKDKT